MDGDEHDPVSILGVVESGDGCDDPRPLESFNNVCCCCLLLFFDWPIIDVAVKLLFWPCCGVVVVVVGNKVFELGDNNTRVPSGVNDILSCCVCDCNEGTTELIVPAVVVVEFGRDCCCDKNKFEFAGFDTINTVCDCDDGILVVVLDGSTKIVALLSFVCVV
ncbi:hypothetical protein BLA29_002990 [Euroglyphus maynei]|uniref:Uncharacterized protein n=1 Tax=Euroglyphus maynei TaxID=6958 RepID=A0A1Y3BKV2_EURMA|nr:hypothetical protein BLA29_002990 [Euroglyphus maynei]